MTAPISYLKRDDPDYSKSGMSVNDFNTPGAGTTAIDNVLECNTGTVQGDDQESEQYSFKSSQ
jgi:hypothetical protein